MSRFMQTKRVKQKEKKVWKTLIELIYL